MRKIYLLLFIIFTTRSNAQNNALSFGSGFDDVNLAYSSALNFDINDKYTIECWVKTTASYAAIIWSNHVDLSPFEGHEMAIVNGKAVMDMTENYITAALRVETINTVNDGNWHHIAFVYKGIPNLSGCEIYIDGVSQTLNANPNNLIATSTSTVTNEVHMGSRDNTTYFSDIALDEVRVWKRVLCAAEIQAHKNCSLVGNEPQLEAYYKFNQGMAGGNNSSITTVIDNSGHGHTGTLTGFVLNGTSSNWITSTAPVTGTCSTFGAGILTITGTNTICAGMVTNLSANGASTYTWLPGNMQTANVMVSPSVTTTYTVYATTPANCLLTNYYTLTVLDCTGLDEITIKDNVQTYPNPSNGHFTIEVTNNVDITIMNALGQKVFETKLHSGTNHLELNDLNEGIYFICGKNAQGKWQKKVVVCR